ncbi:MAG: phosphoribosylglycinamide formyltransferase-1 [Chlamydiales bacterium]|jgi:phosphoribosylglycinamide formyltransferase-1
MGQRLGVFVSGTGRHLENFAQQIAQGHLQAEIGLVLSNKAGVKALERAQRLGLDSCVLDPERELDAAAFSERAFASVEEHGCGTVLLAGFLRKLVIPQPWIGRVLNIHPSLLPAFGGKGFYGSRVHRAVLERGCQFSGCTVHYVDNEYDHGPILLQRCLRVEGDDTPDSLAGRVFDEEQIAYPEAVQLHLQRLKD